MSQSNKALERERKKQEEALKKVYRAQLRDLQGAIEEEERQTTFFHQEREKLNYQWMLNKKQIEEKEAELMNKKREKEELEEKHRIENKLYQARIKYSLLKHQDEAVELQKDAEVSLKQLEDAHRVKEKDFKYDIRSLSKTKKEQELLQNDFLHALEKDNIKAIHQLKNDYEIKEIQLRKFFREKMKEYQRNMEEKRKKIIADITEKKNKEIKRVTEDHANMFNSMKNYYSELNKKNLNTLKSLTNQFSAEIKTLTTNKTRKINLMKKKKNIEDPLNKLLEEILILEEKEAKCKEHFLDLKKKNEEYGRLMKDLIDREYKYEVTFQKIQYLQKEKDSYSQKLKDNLHDVQQKSGLRNLILEKKFETIEENLEIKEVQLKEILRRTNLDPTALSNITTSLEEIELMKNELINQLEDELKKIKEAHITMLKTYEAKLAEFGIPVEEMGFQPLIPVDIREAK